MVCRPMWEVKSARPGGQRGEKCAGPGRDELGKPGVEGVRWKEGAGRWQRGSEDSSLGAPLWLVCRKQEEGWFGEDDEPFLNG